MAIYKYIFKGTINAYSSYNWVLKVGLYSRVTVSGQNKSHGVTYKMEGSENLTSEAIQFIKMEVI